MVRSAMRGGETGHTLANHRGPAYSSDGCRGQPATNENRMHDDFERFASDLRPILEQQAVLRAEDFERFALQLFALQFVANAPYRAFCEALGRTPATVHHSLEIPAAPTAAFKEFELTCLPLDRRTVVFHSSGTTEQRPSRHFHDDRSLELYEASLAPWFARHLLDLVPNESLFFLSLTPRHSEVPHSSLVYMLESVRRRFCPREFLFAGRVQSGEWQLEVPLIVEALAEAVGKGSPVMIAGTAFNFVHLLDALKVAGRRFELPRGSRVMETGGYKGRSRTIPRLELHRWIQSELGVPAERIVTEYGMCELGSQAYDQCLARPLGARDRGLQFPPWCRPAIHSPETGRPVAQGETGLLRLVDLANVWSVLAVQTEDLAIDRGDRFQLVGRAAQSEARGCSLMTA